MALVWVVGEVQIMFWDKLSLRTRNPDKEILSLLVFMRETLPDLQAILD